MRQAGETRCLRSTAGALPSAAGRFRLLDMAVPELPPQQVKRRLDAGEPLRLLDVREPWECAIARLPGSLNIPLGEIASRFALAMTLMDTHADNFSYAPA